MDMMLSLFVAVLGALFFTLAANEKTAQLGYGAYCCGLLVFLFQSAPAVVKFFTRG
jgi:hypothetical protein